MVSGEQDFLNYLKTPDNMEFTGALGFPTMKGIRFKNLKEPEMIGFNYATADKMPDGKSKKGKIVHFFLADYTFERIWNCPQRYISVLGKYKAIVSPDFSQYTNMPKVMQMWNHYRKMWLSQYYQSQGIQVIPAPCWSTEESFEWCFEGMPKHSCVCISTVGCMQNPKVRILFNQGFMETLKRLEPSQIIFYGKIDDDIRNKVKGIPYVQVDSDMKRRIRSWENNL